MDGPNGAFARNCTAHFNLNRHDAATVQSAATGCWRDCARRAGKAKRRNFKNALAMMAANLEELVLARAAALAGTIAWMAERILAVRSRLRPGRSYPRQSMKPRSKWIRKPRTAA